MTAGTFNPATLTPETYRAVKSTLTPEQIEEYKAYRRALSDAELAAMKAPKPPSSRRARYNEKRRKIRQTVREAKLRRQIAVEIGVTPLASTPAPVREELWVEVAPKLWANASGEVMGADARVRRLHVGGRSLVVWNGTRYQSHGRLMQKYYEIAGKR